MADMDKVQGMKEDVCEWISKLLPDVTLTPATLLEVWSAVPQFQH